MRIGLLDLGSLRRLAGILEPAIASQPRIGLIAVTFMLSTAGAGEQVACRSLLQCNASISQYYLDNEGTACPGETDQNICSLGVETVFRERIGRKVASYRAHLKIAAFATLQRKYLGSPLSERDHSLKGSKIKCGDLPEQYRSIRHAPCPFGEEYCQAGKRMQTKRKGKEIARNITRRKRKRRCGRSINRLEGTSGGFCLLVASLCWLDRIPDDSP